MWPHAAMYATKQLVPHVPAIISALVHAHKATYDGHDGGTCACAQTSLDKPMVLMIMKMLIMDLISCIMHNDTHGCIS